MYTIECKACGGRNEITEDGDTYTCAYCGKKMPLPKITDENRIHLYNRANYFRRQGDFDKAVTAYREIVNKDKSDSEALWGLLLSKYGIDYTEDPHTGEQIPTCNRVQNTSILTDDDFLAVIDNAPSEYARKLYEEEGKRIEEIRQGILSVAKLEDPYDVFICYKELTEGGSRSQDSVMAQDIYDHLTKEGLRVFFARITLEDKLGKQYEPYIYSALNSAKAMLIVTTSAENANSVWVKNEWSRFLSLVKENHDKVIIPCYIKMDPYDLPEELSVFQSQDMGKIGFMQDLTRGVKKVCEVPAPQKTNVYQATTNTNIDNMLDRAFICLQDGDFDKADEISEKVLNMDSRCARAYLVKLLAYCQISKEDDLEDYGEPIEDIPSYQHAIQFGDSVFSTKLKEYSNDILEKNEQNVRNLVAEAKGMLKNLIESKQTELEAEIKNKKDADEERGYLGENFENATIRVKKQNNILMFVSAVPYIISIIIILYFLGGDYVKYGEYKATVAETILVLVVFGFLSYIAMLILGFISRIIIANENRGEEEPKEIDKKMREQDKKCAEISNDIQRMKNSIELVKNELSRLDNNEEDIVREFSRINRNDVMRNQIAKYIG